MAKAVLVEKEVPQPGKPVAVFLIKNSLQVIQVIWNRLAVLVNHLNQRENRADFRVRIQKIRLFLEFISLPNII